VDTTGLKLADSDMLVVLLKSLPETVKNHVLHQQRRRSVVGLLCQLGFYVWPVTWQELDQKNVKTS